MASTSRKQSTQSPVPQRKPRKTNNVNLHAEKNDEITVVGIGASAGGLKALQTFFEALPNASGMAYVVFADLHPEHESLVADILQHHTQMPVTQVSGLVTVKPNHIYVIPPNRRFVMDDNKIDVAEFNEPRLQHTRTRAEESLMALNATLTQDMQAQTLDPDEANPKIGKAQELFYTLFHANPVPTALITLEDNVILNVNAEFLDYFGFQREDVIGHSAQEFNRSLGLGTSTRADWINQIRRNRKIRNFETVIMHPSGERRNLLASIQYMDLEETEALVATFIDITDRVRAEQQIHLLASELTATEQAERHRLAQILHDDLQQRMFAIQMQLSFLKDAYDRNDLQAFQIDFPQLEEWLAESIQVTRQLSVDLSPPILHGDGLLEATVWLAQQMHEKYNLDVKIQADGRLGQLDEQVRVLVFNALRELLFNVVKHSGTLEATVAFENQAQYLKVIVRDRGSGFAGEANLNSRTIGHGLFTLHQRLNLLGCNMEVKSEIGNGTEIMIGVPYGQTKD